MKARVKKLSALILALFIVVAMVPVAVLAAVTVNDLSELNTAIGNGEDIILDADITGDVTFPNEYEGTLDLNGKKILGTTINDGILTIEDSSQDKSGALVAQGTGSGKSALTNNTGATLSIHGGTFTRSEGTNWYVVQNKGTIKEITAGDFKNVDASKGSATFDNRGTIQSVSGGTFTGGNIAMKVEETAVISDITGGIFRSTNSDGSALQNWGTVKISGGDFVAGDEGAAVFALTFGNYASLTTIENGNFEGGYAIYCNLDTSDVSGTATVTVNGGTFSGEVKSNSSEKTFGAGSTAININDGTFDGTLSVLSTDSTAELNVAGGTFTDENVEDFLASGLIQKKNAAGDFVVLETTPVSAAFEMSTGTTQTKTLGVQGFDYNLGGTLPRVSKSGYTFNGWNFAGIAGTHKTLTVELLEKAQDVYNGTTAITATPSFTVISTSTPGVTVESTTNGTVTVDKTKPKGGDTVTITVTPAKGYRLGQLAVKNGAVALTVKDNGNGTYSFTYPTDGVVTIDADFIPGVTISKTVNGKLTVNKNTPNAGEAVTVTVTPDKGYVLDKLTVKNDTAEIIVTDNKNGTYTFTYPANGTVDIEATFKSRLPFTDVKTDQWYYEAAAFTYENDLFDGTTKTTFSPIKNMTRAMMVQVLFNMTDGAQKGSVKFTDVEDGQWYAGPVSWAGTNKIVNGVGDKRFAPLSDITREQMAVMLYNYATVMKIELPKTRTAGSFADAGSISSWAKEAVDAMYAAQVINGKENNRFDPKGKATRAQVAEMFMNFVNVTKK